MANPIDPNASLKPASAPAILEKIVHPQKAMEDEDSAVTKAEKLERHAISNEIEEPPSKRTKLDPVDDVVPLDLGPTKSERQKGVAPIRPESVCLRQVSVSPWLIVC